MATTIGQAIASIGAEALPGTELILASPNGNGWVQHRPADRVRDEPIDATTTLYLASGMFAAGSVHEYEGRKQENLRAIMWLPLDADLHDYSTLPQSFFHRLSQDDLDQWIAAQRQDLEEVFSSIGLPIHRLDYTGYGLCAYLYLEPKADTDVAMIRESHKAIIEAINGRAGYQLVDPSASDAGTRITRLPGSWNLKNQAKPRQVTTLAYDAGASVTADQLRFAMRRAQSSHQPEPPPTEKALSQATMDEIVAAVRPHWTPGGRHALSLGLVGMLAKAGVPEPQALTIIADLSDDDEEPGDRERTVRDTYGRLASGLSVRGFFSLKAMLPEAVLAYLDDRLQRYREATTGAFRAGSKSQYVNGSESDRNRIDEQIVQEFPDPPEAAFYGWLGVYRDIMAPTSEAPDAFHLGAGLTLAGSMIGRRVWTEYASDQLYANLFSVLIGASGSSRKDTAMKRATRLAQLNASRRYVQPAFGIRRDVASAEGLVTLLKEEPNTLLYLTELTGLMKNTKRKATSGLLDKLIEAWDTPETLQNLNKQSPVNAKDPFLSIVAATQPGRLAIEMTDEDVSSGFANRWMYFIGKGKPPMARPAQLDRRVAWDHYLALHDAIHSYDEDTSIAMDESAFDRWDDWYVRTTNEVSDDENRQVMRVRHATMIQKVALIYAVSARSAVITDEHLACAIALMDWMWKVVQQLMTTWGASLELKLEERILTVLHRERRLTRRRLQQVTRNRQWSARDFANVLRAMIENQTLDVDPEGYLSINPEVA